MIDQGSSLAISCGCDQIPDEAFDILVPFVMVETVHQDGSANGFHILLSELTFVASMRKDVCPSAPAVKQIACIQMVPLTTDLKLYLNSQVPVLGRSGSKLLIVYIR